MSEELTFPTPQVTIGLDEYYYLQSRIEELLKSNTNKDAEEIIEAYSLLINEIVKNTSHDFSIEGLLGHVYRKSGHKFVIFNNGLKTKIVLE